MDVVTSLTVLLPILTGLALVDALSIGTLAVPVWLLMAPGKVRVSRMLIYLATIGGVYYTLGLALLSSSQIVLQRLHIDWQQPVLQRIGFILGAGLVALSFILEPKKQAKHSTAHEDASASRIYAKINAWRQSAVEDKRSGGTGTLGLMGIGVTAGLLEVPAMLPYLAAIGMITTSAPERGPVQNVLLLAGYCAVMLVPALVLLAVRVWLKSLVTPMLPRIDGWLARHAQSILAWTVGVLGVVLMVNTWSAVAVLLPG